MKKKFLLGLSAVAMLLSTSCSQDDFGKTQFGDEANVTLGINVPSKFTTRAYGDGTTAQQLKYAVYEVGTDGETLTLIKEYDPETINISKQVNLTLATGRTYGLVFWAADATAPYTVDFTTNGATMTANYEDDSNSTLANDERMDAFYAYKQFTVNGDVQMQVELYRPFAQINVGTNDLKEAEELGILPEKTSLMVTGYTGFNLVTGEVTGELGNITFNFNEMPKGEIFPVEGYQYMAMAYVLVPEEQTVADVTFNYQKDADNQTRKVSSAPVQRNYRTNIYGQVLTSTTELNVIIVPNFYEPDYNLSKLVFAGVFGGKVVLDGDVNAPNEIQFSKDAIIDLNGYKISRETAGDAEGVFYINNGANVTVRGNGEITTSTNSKVFYVNNVNSVLTIEDGTFIGGFPAYVQKGTCYIKGGYFESNNTNEEYRLKFLLNCRDAEYKSGEAKFIVTGGTFVNFDPSNSASENPNGNFVAPGYKVVVTEKDDNTKLYTVVPEAAEAVKTDSELAEAIKTPGALVSVMPGDYGTFPTGVAEGVTIDCAPGTVFKGTSTPKIKGGTIKGATFTNESPANNRGSVSLGIEGRFINCKFTGKNAMRYAYTEVNAPVYFEGCEFSGEDFACHFDGHAGTIEFKNCTFSGRSEFAAQIPSIIMDGCTFRSNEISDNNYVNFWGVVSLKDCNFEFVGKSTNEWVDFVDKVSTVEGCYINGTLMKGDNTFVKKASNVIFK